MGVGVSCERGTPVAAGAIRGLCEVLEVLEVYQRCIYSRHWRWVVSVNLQLLHQQEKLRTFVLYRVTSLKRNDPPPRTLR